MKIKTASVLGASLAACGHAWAAAPALTATKTMTIDAPVSKVWALTKDFNALNAWHPALASDEIVEGRNNVVGAVRVLTLKGGGTVKEKLLAYDAGRHMYKYAIIEGVIPVSRYTSTFVIKSAGEGRSMVVWTGHFKRKNPGDNPGDAENDKAAVDAINGVYQGGLDNLKKIAEAK